MRRQREVRQTCRHGTDPSVRSSGGRNQWVLALLFVAALVFLAGEAAADPTPAAQEGRGRASVSRGSGSSGGGGSRATASRGSSAGRSGGRSTAVRGGSGSAGRTRPSGVSGSGGRTSVHRPPHLRRPIRSGGGFRGHGHLHLGFGYYGYPYYLGWYRYPYRYYGYYGYPGYYGLTWRTYQATATMGGLDLNVKPKKAEVYVDGQRLGKVGAFDGYPSVLWLEEGTYELVVYRPGYRTLHQTVKVFPGVVIDIDERLVEGESVPPEEIVPPPEPAPEPSEGARYGEEEPSAGAPSRSRGGAPVGDPPATEPGRLYLEIQPRSASVYLDGRFLGTARELSGLRSGLMVNPGRHRLEVIAPSHEGEDLQVDVEPGDDLDVVVQLEAEGRPSDEGRDSG